MKKYLLVLPFLLYLVFCSSCRKDFDFADSNGNLEFSKDTVFLDTVFTNIGSSTYTLKVYNRSNTDINVPSIRLEQEQGSSYRLNVDGNAGKVFENVPILAKDSIFIFIETTFDIDPINENQFLYTDKILFDSGGNEQAIPLITLVQDAVFLFPSALADGTKETLLLGLDADGNEVRIEGFILDDDQLNFTNERPYVIYGYAAVGSGKTLTIDPGVRVHFHSDSGILVGSEGRLQVNGLLSQDPEELENEVIFEGDRLEPEFANNPGQWGTIWITPGSTGNRIAHLTIKNATVGMLVEGEEDQTEQTILLKNTQIHNSSSINLWARTAVIEGENNVFGNAGNVSLYCNLGGNYRFTHSTIANYWRTSFRTGAALQIDNFVSINESDIVARNLVQASFINSIIDGNNLIELLLDNAPEKTFNFNFTNCLIQFNDTNRQIDTDKPIYDFNNTSLYAEILFNETTDFTDTQKSDFSLGADSKAIDFGLPAAGLSVPLDLLGNDRTTSPDAGAYEFLPIQ